MTTIQVTCGVCHQEHSYAAQNVRLIINRNNAELCRVEFYCTEARVKGSMRVNPTQVAALFGSGCQTYYEGIGSGTWGELFGDLDDEDDDEDSEDEDADEVCGLYPETKPADLGPLSLQDLHDFMTQLKNADCLAGHAQLELDDL